MSFPTKGVCVLAKSLQLCPTLCDPMDCSSPGSSVHGILRARILEWGCHALLQGIFPTQELNPGLLHCKHSLHLLSHQGNQCLLKNKAPGYFRKASLSWVLLHLTLKNLKQVVFHLCALVSPPHPQLELGKAQRKDHASGEDAGSASVAEFQAYFLHLEAGDLGQIAYALPALVHL